MKNKILKPILILIGSISLVLGVLGIFLPVLPTTPFLILTAACYMRSSEKLYNWLITHKTFGSYIKHYMENKAIPLKAKVLSLVLMWTAMINVILLLKILFVKILLLLTATLVTRHILSLQTLKD